MSDWLKTKGNQIILLLHEEENNFNTFEDNDFNPMIKGDKSGKFIQSLNFL